MSIVPYSPDIRQYTEFRVLDNIGTKSVEGFDPNPDIDKNANVVHLVNEITSNYSDLCGNIVQITNDKKTGLRDLLLSDEKYDYRGTSFLFNRPKVTINDAVEEDSLTLLNQENNMFILASITVTTLFITAVMLGVGDE